MKDAQTRRRADARRWAVAGLSVLLGAGRVSAQELVTARFDVAGPAAVDSVRRLGIDIVEVRPQRDGRVSLVAVVSDRDRSLLGLRGLIPADVPRAPFAAAMEARRQLLGARAFTVYRDFDDPARGIKVYLQQIAAARGNVFVDSIGASVEGRPVLAVKIGAPDDSPSRPNVIFVSTYHAREWAATEVTLRLLTFLADSLPLKPGGAALLASRDVWVIPVANPDGYQYTFSTTRLWRKNRRPNPDATFGVDLNRNHSAFFALDDLGSSPQPASEVFRGAAAESEPETQAVAAFHRAHPPVAAVTYHTYTGAILYPWGHVDGAFTGDDGIFRALAGTEAAPAMQDSLPGSQNDHYHPGPGWHLYPTNGDYADWAYGEFGAAAFTVELTSGCCVTGGVSYGFEFPDDDPLLARVARDNLPFALGLLQAAGDLANAVGPSGESAGGARFESVWPRVRVVVPKPAGAPSLQLATDSGQVQAVALTADSLGDGRSFARFVAADAVRRDARAVRVQSLGIVADIVAREGAESPASPWQGFGRTAEAFDGLQAWTASTGTLTSPDIPVTGRSGLTLFFWTKHGGSIFDQSMQGRVEVSTNGGATWTMVDRFVGSAAAWYPAAIPLTVAAGASSLRVRFEADGLNWYLDDIAIAAGETGLFDPVSATNQPPAPAIELSANPVRTPPVTIRWPAEVGSARVDVFTIMGTRVAGVTLSPDPGLYAWNAETMSGAPLVNGLYMIVVTRDDGTRLRRRIFIARGR
ncbi:MAG: M14 family metallopeptidase [Gemmatimonadales bacterium]|nr:M14 family metallopeptidase [Gemmatimonadales bacterium]